MNNEYIVNNPNKFDFEFVSKSNYFFCFNIVTKLN